MSENTYIVIKDLRLGLAVGLVLALFVHDRLRRYSLRTLCYVVELLLCIAILFLLAVTIDYQTDNGLWHWYSSIAMLVPVGAVVYATYQYTRKH